MFKRLVLKLALLGATACAAVPSSSNETRFVGSYLWTDPDEWFGGLSGLELTDDALGFEVVSDRGTRFSGTLTRDAQGVVTDVNITHRGQVRGPGDTFIIGEDRDSEGLALAPDGTLFVSFEGMHRVYAYDGTAASALPELPDRETMLQNGSIEALAIDADGTLYTLPERSGRLTRPFPVLRLKGGSWEAVFELPRSDGFLPVGADFAPNGRLYVLEREFNGFLFRSRIRSIDPQTPGAGWRMHLTTVAGRHGNLEGIALWRDGAGRLRATMVADDNFALFQQTRLVEYILAE